VRLCSAALPRPLTRAARNIKRHTSADISSGDDTDDSEQTEISTPYLPDLRSQRGSSINLTHVYEELHKNEKRRETLREIIEFHSSRLRLRRQVSAALPQQHTKGLGPRMVSEPSPHTSMMDEPKGPVRMLKRQDSGKDLYGNSISPRRETLQRWNMDSELSEAATAGAAAATTTTTAVEPGTPGKSTSDIVRRIRRRNLLSRPRSADRIVRLPRGGVVVSTRIGPIQVGMPPETIKDSMNMGMPIPTIFVVPQSRFHRWRMISVAEFEFPAYFNFFVLQRAVRLVTTKAAEVSLRAAFQESLLGPVDLSMEAIADDFDPNLPIDLRPNVHNERVFFGKNKIDNLLEFVTLREVRNKSYLEADLGDGIFVRLEASEGEDAYVIVDKKKPVAAANGSDSTSVSPASAPKAFGRSASKSPPAPPPAAPQEGKPKKEKGHRRSMSDIEEFPSAPPRRQHLRRASNLGEKGLMEDDVEVLARIPDSVELPNFRTFGMLDVRPEPFVPPAFGVTFLGTSHGFDAKSSTTGFVVWINGVGLLVDPPPNSGPMLELMGIPPRMIRTVLVTHCHADHDAGTMQKLMLDENVTVVTTPTIINSFLRKYSNLTSLPIKEIQSRFIFRSARVGQWMDIFGGEIRVFYAFHTIPCVGFEVRFGNKRIVYSADTFYDPARILEVAKEGVISDLRAQALLDFPFDADLVLHECGVPPIHTPLKCLQALDDDIKSRLFLVHVTASSVPADSGMKVAKEGVENTLVLDVQALPAMASAITVVGWIRDAAPLRGLSIEQLMDLLTVMRLCDFRQGECMTDAVLNDSFLIVGSGAACLFPPGKGSEELSGAAAATAALHGDTSLLMQGDCVFVGGHEAPSAYRPRIVATSNSLRCALFQVADVECFAREGNATRQLIMRWRTEAALRDQFSGIGVLDCLTLRQRALFASMFSEVTLQPGQVLWSAGDMSKSVYVVQSGRYVLRQSGLDFAPRRSRDGVGYDAQQYKEASLQFVRLSEQVEDVNQGRSGKELLCDLPALYHGLPLTSHLAVAPDSPPSTGFVAPASALLSFLRLTPQLLFRFHTIVMSQSARRASVEDDC